MWHKYEKETKETVTQHSLRGLTSQLRVLYWRALWVSLHLERSTKASLCVWQGGCVGGWQRLESGRELNYNRNKPTSPQSRENFSIICVMWHRCTDLCVYLHSCWRGHSFSYDVCTARCWRPWEWSSKQLRCLLWRPAVSPHLRSAGTGGSATSPVLISSQMHLRVGDHWKRCQRMF